MANTPTPTDILAALRWLVEELHDRSDIENGGQANAEGSLLAEFEERFRGPVADLLYRLRHNMPTPEPEPSYAEKVADAIKETSYVRSESPAAYDAGFMAATRRIADALLNARRLEIDQLRVQRDQALAETEET